MVKDNDAEGWCDGFEKCKKKGIEEVVKFILTDEFFADDLLDGDTNWDEPDRYFIRFSRDNWQAKLKEWGIDTPPKV